MGSVAEVWRDAKGFEGRYKVSNHGRVRSVARVMVRKNGQPLSLKSTTLSSFLDAGGYPSVSLGSRSTRRNIAIHILVATAFVGDRPSGWEVNHIDGNKRNPKAENLEYVTRSGNMLHAHRTGLCTPAMGEQNGKTKLTADEVSRIRRMREAGYLLREIASHFNTPKETIGGIIRRRTWKHMA